ncbi:MAG: hypothetical protein IH874_00240 [Candidatus Dadabacteria bacterium]|nr:hypothetical protein [Candidatus Dadabacteria bacterium]
MKWIYKVVPVDDLLSEDDHDIAVSKKAAASRRERIGKGVEENLNNLGSEGWEFVHVIGDLGVFKRQNGKEAS